MKNYKDIYFKQSANGGEQTNFANRPNFPKKPASGEIASEAASAQPAASTQPAASAVNTPSDSRNIAQNGGFAAARFLAASAAGVFGGCAAASIALLCAYKHLINLEDQGVFYLALCLFACGVVGFFWLHLASKFAAKKAQKEVDAFVKDLCEKIELQEPLSSLCATPLAELNQIATALENLRLRHRRAEFFDSTGLASAQYFCMQLDGISPSVRNDYYVAAVRIENFPSVLKILPSSQHDDFLRHFTSRLKSFAQHLSCPYLGKENRGLYLLAFASASEAKMVGKSLYVGLSAGLGRINLPSLGYEVSIQLQIGVAPLQKEAAQAINNALTASVYAQDGYALYEPKFDAISEQEDALCSQLASAISRGEIEVNYQPKLSAANEVIGAEALARWRQAGNYCNAADFIALAQKHGLLSQLERTIIRQVCKDAAVLKKLGKLVPISINICPDHLAQSQLVDYLQMQLRENELTPAALELEITEREPLNLRAKATIAQLNALGFSISLDDFGKDYSTLDRLSQLPVSVVKIDKIFVDGLAAGAPNYDISRKIVKGIINMAKDLGKRTIAEGVESEHQIAELKALGCDAYQGHYHYEAMPFAQFCEVLAR